jgi:hypothetical protein
VLVGAGHGLDPVTIEHTRTDPDLPARALSAIPGGVNSGQRRVPGWSYGPGMPMVEESVVEQIVERPTLELLGVA